jgi:hypothetical protein
MRPVVSPTARTLSFVLLSFGGAAIFACGGVVDLGTPGPSASTGTTSTSTATSTSTSPVLTNTSTSTGTSTVPPAPSTCAGRNPNCFVGGCDQGFECRGSGGVCKSSGYACDDKTGTWVGQTEDCGGGTCVPVPPANFFVRVGYRVAVEVGSFCAGYKRANGSMEWVDVLAGTGIDIKTLSSSFSALDKLSRYLPLARGRPEALGMSEQPCASANISLSGGNYLGGLAVPAGVGVSSRYLTLVTVAFSNEFGVSTLLEDVDPAAPELPVPGHRVVNSVTSGANIDARLTGNPAGAQTTTGMLTLGQVSARLNVSGLANIFVNPQGESFEFYGPRVIPAGVTNTVFITGPGQQFLDMRALFCRDGNTATSPTNPNLSDCEFRSSDIP